MTELPKHTNIFALSTDSVTRQVSTDPAPSTSGTPAHFPRPPPAELLQLVSLIISVLNV